MLISPDYASLNAQLHASRPDYGTSGHQWASLVRSLAARLEAHDILDYGCGKQTLAANLADLRVMGYDPAIPELQAPPAPADIVVCTDVLEHVEPDCIDDVMDDLCRVARKAAFVTVATRPAVKRLADGRNAHLTVQPYAWWRDRFLERFDIVDVKEIEGHEFALVLRALGEETTVLRDFRIATFRPAQTAAPVVPAADRKENATVGLIKFDGHRLEFNTPTPTTRWRVETLFTKEPGTISWLNGLGREDVLLDVGANVGMYTVYAGVVRGTRVFAFEPEAQNFALLNANIARNGLQDRVTAYPLAASDRAGPQTLFLSDLQPGGSCHSLGEEVGFDLKPRPSAFRQGSYGIALDDWISTGAIPAPTHLKIDVDGFEHKVLEGARKLLSDTRLRSVLVELNTHLPEHLAAIDMLRSAGFDLDPQQVDSALRKDGPFEGVGEFIFWRRQEDSLRLQRQHRWSLPKSTRARQVLEHVLLRIDAAEVRREPYEHLVIDDVFPADYYAEMLKHFPSLDLMRGLGETGRVSAGHYDQRKVTLMDAAGLQSMTPAQRSFWLEMSEWLHSEPLVHAYTNKFIGSLAPRLSRLAVTEGSITTQADALLVHDGSRYQIGPHTDSPARLITCLYYLPEDNRHADLGTSLYVPRETGFTCPGGPHHDPAKFEKVKTIEFLPNRLLAFPKSDRCFHGVEEITREQVERRLLIDNIRLASPAAIL